LSVNKEVVMAKAVKVNKKKLFGKKAVSNEKNEEVIDPSSAKSFDPKPGESVCRDENII
jgi:hypothetical protein